jgi:hypothetical protein
MLTTLLKPTRGTVQIAGIDIEKDPLGVRRKIGVARIARKDFIHASEVRPQLPPSGSHRKAHGRTRYGLPGPRPHSLGFGSSSSAISWGANAGAPGVDKGGNIFNLTLLGQYGAAAFFQR